MTDGSWEAGLDLSSSGAERLASLRASKSRGDAERTFTRENAPWGFPKARNWKGGEEKSSRTAVCVSKL